MKKRCTFLKLPNQVANLLQLLTEFENKNRELAATSNEGREMGFNHNGLEKANELTLNVSLNTFNKAPCAISNRPHSRRFVRLLPDYYNYGAYRVDI